MNLVGLISYAWDPGKQGKQLLYQQNYCGSN